MLRFLGKNLITGNAGINVNIAEQCLLFDERIWQRGRDYFLQNGYRDPLMIQIVPIMDRQGRLLCYGWQDAEANRELRMLRELCAMCGGGKKSSLQFQDIFPDITEVIVCGCNELAYYFVKYLERFGIPVFVCGRYWELLGYQSMAAIDDDIGRLVIMAEPVMQKNTDLFQRVARSASPGFECINQIYEANILAGTIKDTEGGFEWFLEKIKGKNIVILGTDARAQDAYDLLYQYDIDISCFSESAALGYVGHVPLGYIEYVPKMLLGKQVYSVWESIRNVNDSIFVDVDGKKSALGTSNVDFFDYYGKRRNEQFFLMNDYTDIPNSNLVHVLKGKEVFLAGDEILCRILAEYLGRVEGRDIFVKYIDIAQWDMPNNSDKILCVVHPWYGNVNIESNPKLWEFRESLKRIVNISYSEYFSHVGAFVQIDTYMNGNREKYAHEHLAPKGMLLGVIPWMSVNILIRGLLDGHPNILQVPMSVFNDNLFWYCVRMTYGYMEMKDAVEEFNDFFPNGEIFKKIMEKIGSSTEKATSQELFVAFHLEYMECTIKVKIEDISQMIVYWEPHLCPREELPILAKWLESEKVGGTTLITRRNNVVWYGSNFKTYNGTNSVPFLLISIKSISGVDARNEISLQNWNTCIIRFEDLKLHPQEEMLKLCDVVGIPWSDTMLHTTHHGHEWKYEDSIVDFDIKPVFNSYEEYLSEFDRFRILLISTPYREKYGYIYEDCLKFSRMELQEMFLKKFRFQDLPEFETEAEMAAYFLCAYDLLRQQLWETRKHAILNDIIPEFGGVELGRTASEEQRRKKREADRRRQKELERLMVFVKEHKKLILYGIGRDCAGLWRRLDKTDQDKVLFCDRKAVQSQCIYQGKKVIAPWELRNAYCDYGILVTSSQYGHKIQMELQNMGINQERIICNTVQLWEEDETS